MKTPEELAEEYSNPAKLDRRTLALAVRNHMNNCRSDYLAGYHAALNSEGVNCLKKNVLDTMQALYGLKQRNDIPLAIHGWVNLKFEKCREDLAQFEALTKKVGE